MDGAAQVIQPSRDLRNEKNKHDELIQATGANDEGLGLFLSRDALPRPPNASRSFHPPEHQGPKLTKGTAAQTR